MPIIELSDTIEGIDLSEFMGVKSSAGTTPSCQTRTIKLLNDNQDRYSIDNIKRLQSLFTSKTLLWINRFRSYLKRYDNQISIDFLDNIAILSINLVKAEALLKNHSCNVVCAYPPA